MSLKMKSTTKGILSLILQGGIATLLFTALIVGTNIAYFMNQKLIPFWLHLSLIKRL